MSEITQALRDVSCGYASLVTATDPEEEEQARSKYLRGLGGILRAFADLKQERDNARHVAAFWQRRSGVVHGKLDKAREALEALIAHTDVVGPKQIEVEDCFALDVWWADVLALLEDTDGLP